MYSFEGLAWAPDHLTHMDELQSDSCGLWDPEVGPNEERLLNYTG